MAWIRNYTPHKSVDMITYVDGHDKHWPFTIIRIWGMISIRSLEKVQRSHKYE